MITNKRKIGLALSGGAVYGIAHLGVIKILEEYKIPIDIIAGTSVGSLVGAFLAAGYSSDQLFELAQKISWTKFTQPTIPKMGLLNSKQLERFIEAELGKIEIPNLQKPFAAVAVDLTTRKQKILDKGSVSQAIRASCAIPGVFTPLIQGDEVLVDGGVLNFIPTELVRDMGADYIIAVKLSPSVIFNKPPENIIQIMVNSFQLTLSQLAIYAPDGDTTIIPDLEGLNPHDFNQAEKLYQRGRVAALEVIEKIKSDVESFGTISDILKTVKKKIIN